VLPTAIIVETVLGKPYAKELWKIPLADNIMKRRKLNVSEDLCNELT
jgi:hypothetical protein